MRLLILLKRNYHFLNKKVNHLKFLNKILYKIFYLKVQL